MAVLEDVYHNRPVEIMPYVVKGIHSQPLTCKGIILDPSQVEAFINYVIVTHQRQLIEETLQGLCKRDDGTLELSAFPSLADLKQAVSGIDEGVFDELLSSLRSWDSAGCNEVVLHFEEVVKAK